MKDGRVRRVIFVDQKLFEAFQKLEGGRFEEKELAGWIREAVKSLKENPSLGLRIPQRLWPKEYVQRFSINNLRKYDLPSGWRLLYSLRGTEIEILSIILEWLSHKEYEKRFKYNVK